ncbi:MAG: M15 family metallopeptidase [Polyangiaceae bacterium]
MKLRAMLSFLCALSCVLACGEGSGAADDDLMRDAGSTDAGPFDAIARPLTTAERTRMTGVSWRPECPVSLDDLTLLDVPHYGFDGAIHRGRVVVAKRLSTAFLTAFKAMYVARFRIEKMRLVDEYGADDDASMADNNTSAFNCRKSTGGTSWSQHTYGNAIDINPVQNPYVKGATVLPPAGAPFRTRDGSKPGVIVKGDAVVKAFDALGWGWGGRWTSFQDYQHFSENGR